MTNVMRPPADMDPVASHLDRGWELLCLGRIQDARLSARAILNEDNLSPEGHCLLGAVAVAEGDAEEALELFQRAMDLAPEYADPLLHAAELCVHSLGEYELGMGYCKDARTLALGEADALDVQLLLIEAHLGAGELQAARRAAWMLPPPPFPEAAHHLRVGRALVELGHAELATEVLADALSNPATAADAHYLSGLALELQGEHRAGRQLMARSLELELEQPPDATLELDSAALETLLHQAVTALPEVLQAWYEGVPTTITELPPLELVVEGLDPRCPALACGGWAPDHDPAADPPPAAAQLFIYQRNVQRAGPVWEVMIQELVLALELEAEQLTGITRQPQEGR